MVRRQVVGRGFCFLATFEEGAGPVSGELLWLVQAKACPEIFDKLEEVLQNKALVLNALENKTAALVVGAVVFVALPVDEFLSMFAQVAVEESEETILVVLGDNEMEIE